MFNGRFQGPDSHVFPITFIVLLGHKLKTEFPSLNRRLSDVINKDLQWQRVL